MGVGQLSTAVVPPGPFFFQAQDGWKWDEQAGGLLYGRSQGRKPLALAIEVKFVRGAGA